MLEENKNKKKLYKMQLKMIMRKTKKGLRF